MNSLIDRIYIVHVASIANGELNEERTWGYYFDYSNAEKAIINNITDIFEMGYYNYAVISEMRPGVAMVPENYNDQKWFKAEYDCVDIKLEDDPKVTPCNNPIPSLIFSF